MYGAGFAYEVSPSFDIRVEYRGLVSKVPTFGVGASGYNFTTNERANMSELLVGVADHFEETGNEKPRERETKRTRDREIKGDRQISPSLFAFALARFLRSAGILGPVRLAGILGRLQCRLLPLARRRIGSWLGSSPRSRAPCSTNSLGEKRRLITPPDFRDVMAT